MPKAYRLSTSGTQGKTVSCTCCIQLLSSSSLSLRFESCILAEPAVFFVCYIYSSSRVLLVERKLEKKSLTMQRRGWSLKTRTNRERALSSIPHHYIHIYKYMGIPIDHIQKIEKNTQKHLKRVKGVNLTSDAFQSVPKYVPHCTFWKVNFLRDQGRNYVGFVHGGSQENTPALALVQSSSGPGKRTSFRRGKQYYGKNEKKKTNKVYGRERLTYKRHPGRLLPLRGHLLFIHGAWKITTYSMSKICLRKDWLVPNKGKKNRPSHDSVVTFHIFANLWEI